MKIEFQEFKQFGKGILYQQLLDAYSFDKNFRKQFEQDWLEYDKFFYDNLSIANDCGFIMLLNGEPIGHISWDPRNLPDYVIIGHNCIKTNDKGHGYGHILLQEAIDRIKQYKGIKKIVVTTNEALIPAQHNYESVGFQKKAKRKNQEFSFAGDYIDYEMLIDDHSSEEPI